MKRKSITDQSKALGIDYKQMGLGIDSEGNNLGYPMFETFECELVNHSDDRNAWHEAKARELARNYLVIAVEDLDFDEMEKKQASLIFLMEDCQPKSFFNNLERCCKEEGTKFVKVPRFYPSSQICSCCGYRVDLFPQNAEEFFCPKCGLHLNRDLNAAINIRNEGLRMLKSG